MPIKKGSTDFCPAKTSEVYVGNKLVWENVKEKVVRDVTPLTVNDALARPVKTLTRFGECTQPPVTMYSTITQQGKLVQDGTPTPTTPVDIVCNNGVLKVSKNLFDYGYFYDNYQTYTGSTVGRCPIKLQPNTAYTISTNTDKGPTSAAIFVVSGSATNWTPATVNNGVLIGSPRTVTTDSNGYLCLGIYVTGERVVPESDFINGTTWAQIEQGSSATEYMPYGQIYTDGAPETLTIGGQTISVTDLFAIGNYKDALEIVSGVKTKRIRARVLTGSADENWFKASGRNVFSASAFFSDMIVRKTLMYCTHFVYSDDASTSIADFCFGSANTSTNTFFRYDAISSVEGWCAFLAEQLAAGTPVIIVYVLAEETTEQLAPADIVLTYPQTITATTNVGDVTITETHADVSTPSPNTPLPIWCNNGVLTARKPSGLPLMYDALSSVIFDGSSYIDSGIKANSAYTYKFRVKRTSPYASNIWGAKENSSYSADSCLIVGWTGTNYVGVYSHYGAGTGANPNIVQWGTVAHDFVFNPSSKILEIDGVDHWGVMTNGDRITNLTNASWESSSLNLYIGGTNTVGEFAAAGVSEWSDYEVWNGETLLQKLKPVRRHADNVVGLYDMVSGEFLTNAGSGSITAGDPISDPVEFVAIGTPETLTIGGGSRVPAGWTEVEYIESDGTSSAFVPALQAQNSEFHLDFQYMDGTVLSYQDAWSGFNLSNEGIYIERDKTASPQKLFVCFNSPNAAVFTPDFSSRLVLDATVGTDSFTAVLNGDSQTVSGNIRQSGAVTALFGMSYGDGTGATSFAPGRLYSAWHKITGTGEYDFYAIPVKNDTTNEYAIYDSASDTIIHAYYGTFTGGAAVAPSEQTVSVTALLGLGDDYTDTHEIISGLKTKKIGAVALTGAETWVYDSPYSRFYTTIPSSIVNPSGTRSIPALCTQYEMLWHGENISDVTVGQGYIVRKNVSAETYLQFHSDLTTVEAFTAKVAERFASGKPIIVIYPLADETTEQLTPQPLNMVKGTNTLSSVSELGTVVDVELIYYVKRIVT